MTPTVTLNTGVEILEAGYRSIDTAAVAAGSGRGPFARPGPKAHAVTFRQSALRWTRFSSPASTRPGPIS